MKVLAIETSTLLGGVAIVDSEKGLLAEIRLNVKSTHSERLMSAIDCLLGYSGMQLQDMNAIAAAVGPGSFTGLRIGLSTAKGIVYASGAHFLAVPTFDAFVRHFMYSALPVCLMLDARKGEVYASLSKWEQTAFKNIDTMTTAPEALLDKLSGEHVFAGEGALLHEKLIRERLKDRAIFAPDDKMIPAASHVAMVALEKARLGQFDDARSAQPLYIRRSEAEEKWEERHGRRS